MNLTKPWRYVLAAVAALVVIWIAWRTLGAKPAEPDAQAPAALVNVAPVRAASIDETVSAYGVIAGSPAASRTLAAPRAVIVQRVLVTPGQPVGAGTPLMALVGTPATQLSYSQARDARAFAQRDLERVQRLMASHLAANDQLIAARKTLADAKAAVAAQSAAGAGLGAQTLTAPLAGVVGSVPVALGDHVAEGAPLLTVVATGGLIAQLGVEPTRAARLRPGQSVLIKSAFDPGNRFESHLAVVGRQVDLATRLINVTAPARAAGVALGAAVEGLITVASHGGLLVPRAAVVFDESGAHVFVVRGGKARQVAVKPGAEQGDDLEITGAVAAGEPVAVQGAYQLQDGSAVRIQRR